MQTFYAFFLVPPYPCVYGYKTHLRLCSCLRGRKSIGFQKNCTATHAETMFLPHTEATFEFETLCLGQLQYFCLSHN